MRRIAVLFASMLLAGSASTAAAHTDLVSMTPEPGSTVTEQLQQVVLTFGEEISGLGSSVVVLDPNGAAVQFTVTFTGPNAVVDVMPFSIAGEYRVNFRINSADGHIIEGSEAFTYSGPTETPTAIATLGGEAGEEVGEEAEGGNAVTVFAVLGLVVIGGMIYAMRKKQS